MTCVPLCCSFWCSCSGSLLLFLAAAVSHRVSDGCWFEFDFNAFFLFIQTPFMFNAPLDSTGCRIYGLDLPISSVITGMREAKVGVSLPRRSPRCAMRGLFLNIDTIYTSKYYM